mgnify:CR=1 FL=1
MFSRVVITSCFLVVTNLAFADIYAPLECEQYNANIEAKNLCQSYEKERRELSTERSELYQRLKDLKRELKKLSED